MPECTKDRDYCGGPVLKPEPTALQSSLPLTSNYCIP